jgi:DNA-binding CsgD family transcriptional regulator
MHNSVTIGTRKDFFEYWRSIEKEKDKSDFDITSVLNTLDQIASYSNSAYTITNRIDHRYERVNTDFMRPASLLCAESFLKQGYSYSIRQMRKEYLEFNLQIVSKLMEQELKLYPFEKRPQFEAFLDLHYKLNPFDTHYYRLFQHIKILETDNDNFPVFFINYYTDISILKKNDNSTVAIKSCEGKIHFFHFDEHSKKMFDFKTFSDRELSILNLLEKGLTSKQIADQLFISPNTVDTHRRNLLDMTNCINTTALIIYCRMLGVKYNPQLLF